MRRSYAIIGVGAVGGYYGARLQQAGFDVHYLFHTDIAYQHARQRGLHIQGLKEPALFLPSIQAYQKAEDMPACDVVIIALKTTKNKYLSNILPHVLKDNSIIIVMQNGLGNEEDIATFIDQQAILCGIITLGAAKIQQGVIDVNYNGPVWLAAYREQLYQESAMQCIAADFELANIPVELSSDHLFLRWRKLLWNIPFGGLSVIHNTTSDKVANSYGPLFNALAAEIIAIAKVYGREIPWEYAERFLSATQARPDYKPSMFIDYEQKKPLELEYIYAKPLAAAKAKGVQCPQLESLYAELLSKGVKTTVV